MTKNTTPLTIVNKTDAKEVKYYLIDGIRYATAPNWRSMGLQPSEKAIVTTMRTKQGYEFKIYAESQTEAYDAEAHAKKVERQKELKKQKNDLFKLYMKHEIGLVDYTTELARLETELAK